MTPYRIPAPPAPHAPSPVPSSMGLAWYLRGFAFALCWALRLRVVLTLNVPEDRMDLAIQDGWTREGEQVSMPVSELDRMTTYVLAHPYGVPLEIVSGRSITSTLHVPPPMLASLKMVLAAAWLDLNDQLHRASVVVHWRPLWLTYSERLFLRAWRV